MKTKIRKKINRSGKMECQICNQSHILVQHHINGRDIDNYNASWNITNICDNCHRLVHEGKIVIEKWIMTTDGLQLMWHHEKEDSFTGTNSNPHIIGS